MIWRGVVLVLAAGAVCAAIGYALGAAIIQSGGPSAAATGLIGLVLGWALWRTRPAARAPASRTRQQPRGGPDQRARRR
ncbi:MAG TPA: hypothetical protein VFW96_11155 [Thermomicrobiales bacterium]|nr:hypothetical protein [Thermomicrobiales bacterium]